MFALFKLRKQLGMALIFILMSSVAMPAFALGCKIAGGSDSDCTEVCQFSSDFMSCF
jgi:hypothetical protein